LKYLILILEYAPIPIKHGPQNVPVISKISKFCWGLQLLNSKLYGLLDFARIYS